MPRFDVELIDPQSGIRKKLQIEAVDTDDLRQTAERMGYVAGQVATSDASLHSPTRNQWKSKTAEASDADGVDVAAGFRIVGLAIAALGVLLIGWFLLMTAEQDSQRFTGVLAGILLIVLGVGSCIASRVMARR